VTSAEVYGEVTADGKTLVLITQGDAYAVSQAAARLEDVTPLMSDSAKTLGQPGGMTCPLTWPAVVQLQACFGRQWRTGPHLQAWVEEQIRRRTAQDPRLYVTPPPGKVPRSYQVTAAAMMREAGSCLLFDDMGTGKSVSTVLGLVERAAQRHPVLPVVVVCPASVMDSWVDHFRDWAPFWRVIAWRGSPQRRRRLMGTADIYVCSYGTAVRDAPGQLDKDGKRIKSHPLLELGPCAVVSDELHKIKGNATAQSHAVRRMAEQVHQRSGIFVGLSGTPITHSPGDAWPGLYCLEPGANPSKDRWVMRYCQFKREEYSVTATGFAQHREPEFRLTVLGQNRRVSKADVLTELPPKMWTQRWVDIPTKYRQAYDDMAEDMLAQLPDTGEELKVFAILDQLNRLQSMASSSGTVRYTEEEVLNAETGEWETKRHTHLDMRRPSWKVDELIEIMREREGRPVVTFAHSSQLMRMAGEQATEEGYRVGYIIGGQSAKERTRNVKAFQAGELDLICVTTGAGGVGITLTRSDCCVFLQRPWSLVEATQSEDRLHRIGAEQHESIEIIDVLARNSVDSRVRSVLKDRAGQLSDFVQDPRIVAEILGGAEVRQLRKAG
jgi:SNF2 family DNA or RNA helicase